MELEELFRTIESLKDSSSMANYTDLVDRSSGGEPINVVGGRITNSMAMGSWSLLMEPIKKASMCVINMIKTFNRIPTRPYHLVMNIIR